MLPNIKQPTFIETLTDGKRKIKYRPFDIEEQKSVLIAGGFANDSEVVANLVNLINACSYNKIDFNNERVADFEKMLLAIRSKSVGEAIEIGFTCMHEVEEGDDENDPVICKTKNTLEIDFMKNTTFTEEPNSIIDLDDTIKIKLKPILMSDVIDQREIDVTENLFNKVEWISEGETIFTEFSLEEFKTFVKTIPPKPAEMIVEYYKNQRSAVLTIPTRCRKCGTKSSVDVKGAINFFG